jgi:hypothetical protein
MYIKGKYRMRNGFHIPAIRPYHTAWSLTPSQYNDEARSVLMLGSVSSSLRLS